MNRSHQLKGFNSSGLSLVEVLLAIVLITALVLTLLPLVSDAYAGPLRAACTSNMKGLSLSFLMYANEHNGSYPPIAARHGTLEDCGVSPVVPLKKAPAGTRISLSPNMNELYPYYFDDPDWLICPSDPDLHDFNSENPVSNVADLEYHCAARCRGSALANHSYTYLGFWSPEVGHDLASAHAISAIQPFSTPIDSAFADILFIWNRQFPVAFVPATKDVTGSLLDVRLIAMAQSIFDTAYRGDPASLADLVEHPIGLGAPGALIDDARTNSWPTTAPINNSSHQFDNGRTGFDLDYSTLLSEPRTLDEYRSYEYLWPWHLSNVDALSRSLGRPRIEFGSCMLGVPYEEIERRNKKLTNRHVPVMWERIGVDGSDRNHRSGANILFLDGHVEYLRYGSTEMEKVFPEPVRRTIEMIQHYVDSVNYAPTGNPRIDAQCP